ncbi:hypothetical protein GCM10027093_27610 [Paraburkholderia jirisanensis]
MHTARKLAVDLTRSLRRWRARRVSAAPAAAASAGAASAGGPAALASPLMLALEPRIVYDASAAAIGAGAGAHASGGAAHHHHHEADAHPADAGAAAKPAASKSTTDSSSAPRNNTAQPVQRQTTQDTAQDTAQNTAQDPARDTAQTAAAPERQVVFIDPSVANYQQLIAGLPAGTDYVILSSTSDGLAQIAQYLQQHPGVDAIHLVSHGTNGAIQVGAVWLTQSDIAAYNGELAQIGAAMKPGGDFLIYGCDVAENSSGQALVQQIATATHLNVAASTDATGAAALGGDWTLEYDVGAVHTSTIFSAASEQQFGELLGVTVDTYDSDGGFDTTGTTFTLDGITYTTNQPAEFEVVSSADTPGVPLSSGPSDEVLLGNVGSTGMTSLTMTLQNGHSMSVQSFDIDIFAPAIVAVQALDASGNVIGTITLDTDSNGGSSTFHVDLSGNSAFANVKSLRFLETDGNLLTPTLNNFTYTDVPPAPPHLAATGGSSSFVSGDGTQGPAVAIDPGMTLTDGSATASSAVVSITTGLHSGEDVLAFTNNNAAQFGDITGTYNALTGVLSLTSASGTATIAQWQNAFDNVTYKDTAAVPLTNTRTISFSLTSDGSSQSSNTVQKTVTVTATDQTPKVTGSGSTASYGSGAAATTVDTHIGVTDTDNATQSTGTVSVSSGFHTGDTLSFTNTSNATFGNITATYDGAGTLTLFSAGATATDAQWAAALSAVTFSSNSHTYGNRTLSFSVNDGVKNSVAVTDTINVVNPVLVTTDSGSTSFVAGDNTTSNPVSVDPGITLTDSAITSASSATVSITGNFHVGEDVLGFTNTSSSTFGDISATYVSGTGVLTLTSASGTASIAQWQNALRAVSYTDSAITPNNATRTISFTVTDSGGNVSNTGIRGVTVTDVDQTPTVATSGTITSYVGGHPATPIDGGIAVNDRDNTTLASGIVSITGNLQTGDTLAFTNNNTTLFGNITATYSGGVLTLNSAGATATDAQWANALSAVTFSSSSNVGGNRTISFSVSDGVKTSVAKTDTVSVLAPPVVTTDSGSAAFISADNAPSTPVVVDSGVTVTDGASTTLGTATVSITGNFHSTEDVLSFNNDGVTMGNITASYDPGTGVLTLTSVGHSATLAQWQSALRSVTYTDTAVSPDTATRTISFTLVDGANNTSAASTRTITVTAVDQTPIVSDTGGTTASYVGGHPAVTIDGGITVSDLDNTTLASGTVSITGGLQSGDTLSFTNTSSTLYGNITATYSAGVLTLNSVGATATDAQWANALSAVQFSSTSVIGGARTISFKVSDGTKTSTPVTDTVNVIAPPVVTTDGGSATFMAGDNTTSTPVTVDAGLTLTDGASTTFVSATVAITGNFHAGEDVLGFTNDGATMGNITATYDAGTGVLTLSSLGGTATIAQWEAALQAVQYTDTAITPDNPTRTISFTATDGAGVTSNTATRTVTVTDTDQTPIVTTTGGTTNYVGGTGATTIDSSIAVSDLDNTTLTTAKVTISSGFHIGDVLQFINTGSITGSYNASTGELTLTGSGSVTLAQWQSALSSIQFFSSSTTFGTRTLSYTVNDGLKTSVAATDTVAVLGPPQITTDSGSAAFTAGDNTSSTPVAIDGGLTLTDGSSLTFASATVAITGNFHAGEDVLSFANDGASMGNISATYDAATGILTLTSSGATATIAQWQAALEAVRYTDTAITPNTATRTVSFTAIDGGGVASNTAVRTVTVTDTDQTPIVTTTGGTTTQASGAAATAIDSGISVTDLDNSTLASAKVSISAGFQNGDTLAFNNTGTAQFGNITASYDASTGELTLNSAGATATDAQWANALSAVSFASTSTAFGNRTISFSVNDGSKTSLVSTDTVNLAAPPQVTTDAGSANFVEGDNTASTPVAVDSGLALSDGASTTLASATVAITGGFHAGEDVLSFANDGATMGNITASYDAGTGVMTLNSAGGTATLAQWQAALEAVKYTDTAIKPDTTTRTVSFSVIDGAGNASNAATRAVNVQATDQSTLVTPPDGGTYKDGTAPTVIGSGITITDLDNPTQSFATVSIGNGFHRGDLLAFVNSNAAAFGNIQASYDADTGVLTLTSSGATATNAQWSRALSEITFASTSDTLGARTVQFVVNDGTKTSATVSATVQVLAVASPVQPAANTSNLPPPNDLPHYPAAAAGATSAPMPAAPILLTSRTTERLGGIVVNNTPDVLAEFEPERPVGEIPPLYTYTFTTDDRPFVVGRTSVPPLPPLVPDSLRSTGVGVDTLPPLTLDVAATGGRFTIDLAQVDGVSLANAANVDVTLANGRPLPAWLHFDAAKGRLSGAIPRGAHDVRVMVQVRDANGHLVRREIIVAPGHHRARHAPAVHAPRGAHGSHGVHKAHAALEPRTIVESHVAVEARAAFEPHGALVPNDAHAVMQPRPWLPAGKPSLADQFAQASAALHIARPASATVALEAPAVAAADVGPDTAAFAAQSAAGTDPSVTHL